MLLPQMIVKAMLVWDDCGKAWTIPVVEYIDVAGHILEIFYHGSVKN
jgi:hypothetical protein